MRKTAINSLIGGTIYRLQEQLLRRPTFTYLRELERSQWLSRQEIEQLQLQKLQRLLEVAVQHCPWHAARIETAGLNLSRPLALADFQKLPAMDKAEAAANRDQLVWRDAPGGAFRYNTGGSSGKPLIFYYGRQRQASDAAGRMRARRWWGVEPGEREVYLWGAPVELNKTDRIKTLRDRLVNQLVLNAFNMSPMQMDAYAQAIQSWQPRCIYGYASSVALLAAHAKERGIRFKLPKLRVVCTTGEPLFPHQRSLIQEVFGVPVANEFGSRDIGFTAHETPHGQMLLISESILLEVLDAQGHSVKPGEVGEAVMSGLCSEVQPFIRYRTGDMVRLSAESCRDGRGLHVISEVVGRSTDFLVKSDGTIMHALAGIYVLRAVEGVAEFKLIQHELRDLEVLVVRNTNWREDEVRKIEIGLKKRMGEDVNIRIQFVDDIEPEASGKHRYVVSHVQLAGGLGIATSAGAAN
jgi:phenylacetate-CoA ligase